MEFLLSFILLAFYSIILAVIAFVSSLPKKTDYESELIKKIIENGNY